MVARAEHVQWCKDRALEILGHGDVSGAFASMISDLRKHPQTEDHLGIMLGAELLFGGHLETADKMKHFIEGFN